MADHVAIVGGGFSGTMLAVQLLRGGADRVTLIERAGEPGRGLAFGAADPIHLLNVPAGNMSAYPDQPDHFVAWLRDQGHPDAGGRFVPRRLFGTYIEQQLAAASADAPGRLETVRASAEHLEASGSGVAVSLADGTRIDADAAVLAVGNLPPARPPGIDPARLPQGVYWSDPWVPGVGEGLGPDDAVLIVGTGLTMVDMVLLLEAQGFDGPILAISRRGLWPRAHKAGSAPTDRRRDAPETRASSLVRDVRERSRALGWRAAVDELRPFTQGLWRDASPDERGRFLRHLRPWWDVHRHRIAPEVHERLSAMIDRGQLRIAAGKLVAVEGAGARADVAWRPRGEAEVERFTASRIVGCTGPEVDLPRSGEPLLSGLIGQGALRPGPCRLGIDVDDRMRVLDAQGRPHPRLSAVGPLTRGLLWEIVAVPDIRGQVQDVARRLVGQGAN